MSWRDRPRLARAAGRAGLWLVGLTEEQREPGLRDEAAECVVAERWDPDAHDRRERVARLLLARWRPATPEGVRGYVSDLARMTGLPEERVYELAHQTYALSTVSSWALFKIDPNL